MGFSPCGEHALLGQMVKGEVVKGIVILAALLLGLFVTVIALITSMTRSVLKKDLFYWGNGKPGHAVVRHAVLIDQHFLHRGNLDIDPVFIEQLF